MIISLFAIPVLFVLVVILLRFGRNDGEKATAPPPAPPRPADPVDAPEALPLTEQWTTLDDYQLNRLLRESSS